MKQDRIQEIKKKIFGLDKAVLFNENQHIEDKTTINIKENQKQDTGKFSLEEIMEILERQSREKEKQDVFIVKDSSDEGFNPDNSWLLLDQELIDQKEPKIILYEIGDGKYYVYKKKKPAVFKNEINPKYSIADFLPSGEDSRFNSMYIPTGVIVERVPQYVLGTGVLGRAFLYQNRIEIADSLIGNDYQEVLTHEVFHILHPQMSERNIRIMTKYFIGDKARYH